MITDINSEDRLVQQTFATYVRPLAEDKMENCLITTKRDKNFQFSEHGHAV